MFTVVNICCLVLRRDTVPSTSTSGRRPCCRSSARSVCAYLVTPLTGRNPQQYVIAGLLLAVGVVLWLITFFINRAMWGRQTYLKNPEALEGSETKPITTEPPARSPGGARPGP